MGFTKPDLPAFDPADLESIPTLERLKLLSQHWVEHGFGSPTMLNAVYVVKTIAFLVIGWLAIGLTTPGLTLTGVDEWWGELIVLQKAMVWMVLFEILGFGCSWGPLAFKFSPLTAGYRYWVRPKTLRSPPWPDKIPFTDGDSRTLFDVGLYFVLIALLVIGLVMPGQQTDAAYSEAGLLPMWPLVAFVALLLVMGARDKVVYLATRAEQYAVALLGFGVLTAMAGGSVEMIAVVKIVMFAVWMGACVSKFGHHFSRVVQAMLSNGPLIRSKAFKRSLYRDPPNDLLPSKVAIGFAHVGGTIVELVLPLVILFSTNDTLTILATIGFILFHLFIYFSFALAVPQEWNIFFVFATPFVFLGFGNGEGYAFWDASAWVVVATFILTFAGIVLGNVKPEWVSFLTSMRQYAGNWASCLVAFRNNDCEEKLDNPAFVKPARLQRHQIAEQFGEDVAELFLQKAAAFRTMHSHGPALLSLMQRHLDDLDNYRLREGEAVTTLFVGWMFGDGHLINPRLIEAIQKRCHFEPGEFVITQNESQPIHTRRTQYRVIDAALGVVELGYYDIRDSAVRTQPWLPDGPIPMTVTWRKPGYQPAGVDSAAAGVGTPDPDPSTDAVTN